jgi:hypothetical protein
MAKELPFYRICFQSAKKAVDPGVRQFWLNKYKLLRAETKAMEKKDMARKKKRDMKKKKTMKAMKAKKT